MHFAPFLKTLTVRVQRLDGKSTKIIFDNSWYDVPAWILNQASWTCKYDRDAALPTRRATSITFVELAIICKMCAPGTWGPRGASLGTLEALAAHAFKTLIRRAKTPAPHNWRVMPHAESLTTTRMGLRPGLDRRIHRLPGESITDCALSGIGCLCAEILKRVDRLGLSAKLDARWCPRNWIPRARPTELAIMQLLQKCATSANSDGNSGTTTRRRRLGPCWFTGCRGTPYADPQGRIVWHAVPTPSPWFGVPAGATLCTRHHALAVKAKNRTKDYRHSPWRLQKDLPGRVAARAALQNPLPTGNFTTMGNRYNGTSGAASSSGLQPHQRHNSSGNIIGND